MIVLVGAPGSGKSTVGRLLGRELGLPFTDIDQVIEARAGRSIAEIFADDGEPAFRVLEESTTLELLTEAGVLGLGGGAVLSERIRAALAGHRVIWLEVGPAAAVQRVGLNQARPLLLGNVRGRLMTLLAERSALYAGVATERVNTDGRRPLEVVAEIRQPRDADV